MRDIAAAAGIPVTRFRPPARRTSHPTVAADVVVIGRPGALTERVRRVLHERGLAVEVVGVRSAGVQSRDRVSAGEPVSGRPAGARSCIAVLDRPPRPRRGWWDWRSRRLERQQEDSLIDAVSDVASNARNLGLLVVAEASTPGETDIARERARHVARVADYEAAINGNPLTSAFYLLTSAADCSSGAFPAVVDWALRGPDL